VPLCATRRLFCSHTNGTPLRKSESLVANCFDRSAPRLQCSPLYCWQKCDLMNSALVKFGYPQVLQFDLTNSHSYQMCMSNAVMLLQCSLPRSSPSGFSTWEAWIMLPQEHSTMLFSQFNLCFSHWSILNGFAQYTQLSFRLKASFFFPSLMTLVTSLWGKKS